MATPPNAADFLPTNAGAATPAPPAPPAMAADGRAAPGGQNFLPNDAVTGGMDSQNPVSQSPTNQDDSTVTPEEQQQYDDFVTRCKLFISDYRPPKNNKGSLQPNGKAPRDVIIEHLNSPGGQNAAAAVGRTAAEVIKLVTNNAKAAGYPYPPDVIFHGADEVISDLYQIGIAAGVIKNPPPDNSEQEQHLLGMAKLYTTQFFGQGLIDSGQDPPELRQQAHQYVLDQIQKEAQTGALEKWNPSQHFSRAQILDFMNRAASGKARYQGRMAPPTNVSDYAQRGHPQLVPPGGAPAPPAAPADGSDDGSADASAAPLDDGSGGGAPPDQSGGQ